MSKHPFQQEPERARGVALQIGGGEDVFARGNRAAK